MQVESLDVIETESSSVEESVDVAALLGNP